MQSMIDLKISRIIFDNIYKNGLENLGEADTIFEEIIKSDNKPAMQIIKKIENYTAIMNEYIRKCIQYVRDNDNINQSLEKISGEESIETLFQEFNNIK